MTLRLVLTALAGLLAPATTHASLTFCNQTTQAIESAVGYRHNNQWLSEGWWRLESKQCVRIITAPLEQRFYYYFARNPKTGKTYGGKYRFCTTKQPFALRSEKQDCGPQASLTGFGAADVGERRQYSFDFRD